MIWFVMLGAAVGAPCRFLVDRRIAATRLSAFPWGTLTVNVVGSLLLGVLLGATRHSGDPAGWIALVGTGFCGGLTTFSTFSFESVRLVQRGSERLALAYVIASVAAGLAAVTAGWLAAVVLWA